MVSLYNRETTDNTAVIESSYGKTHIVKFAVKSTISISGKRQTILDACKYAAYKLLL